MAKQVFSLDGIQFDDVMGVPNSLKTSYESFGSVQRIMQSNGGAPKKIVQLFGIFPGDYIEFTATYRGANAQGKWRQLVAKQAAQTVIALRDGDEVFNGLVWKLEKNKLNRYRLEVTITFAVLSTSVGAASSQSAGTDPQTQLNSQLQTLGGANVDPNFSANNIATSAQAAATSAQFKATVAALGVPTLGVGGLVGALLNGITEMLAYQAGLGGPEISLSTVTLVSLGEIVGTAIAAGQNLQAALLTLGDAGSLAIYTAADSYMGSLTSYLGTLNSITGQDGGNQQPIISGDLFTIAATQLGDATRYDDIMAVNPSITDPFVVPMMNVNIPTV